MSDGAIREPTSPDDIRPPKRVRPGISSEAGRAVEEDTEIGGMSEATMIAGIETLRRERDAVILAHNYQLPLIQDLADFVGDSLQLSRQAAASDRSLIVFCGVHFMAETAAILCPDKKVLLPDPAAGCSLAASVTAAQVREWRLGHPGAVVVAYVNTDADVKAEADYCCTSANAVNVVRSIPADREVLFLPDLFLGLYVENIAGRRMHLWLGECHVHAGIRWEDVTELLARYPQADLLLHPECGCIRQCLSAVSEGELPAERTFVLSTGGMTEHARTCSTPVDLVGTEVGMLHRLRHESPSKTFIALREDAICEYMKTITLPKVYRALRDLVYEARVPADTARRARFAIDRMVATSS